MLAERAHSVESRSDWGEEQVRSFPRIPISARGFLGNVDMGFGVPQHVAGWATIPHDPHSI
ncbi:hypothetical protein [Streptomyces sp. cmx-4-9]|uniref:hypothetical protein n=1 Tax=Streptomyces sp. cmx-4-9 TaxID=2790941 RepID=UPI0039811BF0